MEEALRTLLTNKAILLLNMIFCHLFADFNLQGILAKYKQKEWWKKNAPDNLYRYDYKVALYIHGFMWAFITFAPCWIYRVLLGRINGIGIVMWIVVLGHGYTHSLIDNNKANNHTISLLGDQLLHLLQIALGWFATIE